MRRFMRPWLAVVVVLTAAAIAMLVWVYGSVEVSTWLSIGLAVPAAAAVLNAWLFRPVGPTEAPPGGGRTPADRPVLVCVLGLVVIAAFGAVLLPEARRCALLHDCPVTQPRSVPAPQHTAAPRVTRLISPKAGATVPQTIPVSGTVGDLGAGHELLLLTDESVYDRYYPQSVDVHADGSWTASVTAGDACITHYTLSIVDASPLGLDAIQSYVGSDGIPVNDLPSSASLRFLQTVPVLRSVTAGPGGIKCFGPTGNRSLDAYCASLGAAVVEQNSGSAYNHWYCDDQPVDMVAACRFTYSGLATVVKALPDDPSNPYTWQCYINP
jgi:hypothetical protein